MSSEDHDLLTRIDTNLTNHIELMKTHLDDDKVEFKRINTNIGWLQKIVFIGIGALAVIKYLIK